MNILIVEDDLSLARVIGSFVTEWGHDAETADTGKDALVKFRENAFDLVLLDIFLPDMKGYELIPQLRNCAIASAL